MFPATELSNIFSPWICHINVSPILQLAYPERVARTGTHGLLENQARQSQSSNKSIYVGEVSLEISKLLRLCEQIMKHWNTTADITPELRVPGGKSGTRKSCNIPTHWLAAFGSCSSHKQCRQLAQCKALSPANSNPCA